MVAILDSIAPQLPQYAIQFHFSLKSVKKDENGKPGTYFIQYINVTLACTEVDKYDVITWSPSTTWLTMNGMSKLSAA